MVMFLLLALCEWLPSRAKDSHSSTTFESKTCLWCHLQAAEDSHHVLNCPSNRLTMEHRWREVQDLLTGLPLDVLYRPVAEWSAPRRLARTAAEHIARGRITGEACVALARQYLITTQGTGHSWVEG